MRNVHDPGPCETLARLALQSERYAEEPEFRAAVDAVLGNPVYDAGPALVKAAHAAISHLVACEAGHIRHPFRSASLPLLLAAVAKTRHA